MQGHSTLLRLTLVISLFLLTAIGAQAQGDFVRARVRSATGIARIRVNHQSPAFAPKRNDPLQPGNIIETAQNGRVVISLSDGGQITVLPNSRVVLKDFPVAHSARELLDIVVGRVLVKIRSIGGKPNPYRLNSPAASIAVRGTEFIVDVLLGGETLVVVREGLVEVWSRNNPDNKRVVTPGGRVIVRPGGDISSAFPGPGSELNGRIKFNKGLREDYQSSVDSVAQNSNEISPVFFSAFPDRHLDSLENPAYAADFKNDEGRLLLLSSISKPYDFFGSYAQPSFNYSISPQLTFFTPIPGSRLVVGGGASAFGVRTQYLYDSLFLNDTVHDRQALRLNAFNASLAAAYSFGDHGKTSVGIGIDRLSGYGNYLSEYNSKTERSDIGNFVNLNAWFARTRLTFGLARRFSDGMKLGLYIRHGVNSSDQENHYRRKHDDESQPRTSNFTLGKTNISTLSSEIGARFRGSMTRRLYYGIEGSYLYERIYSRRETLNQSTAYNHNHYLARRARLGAGLGFALTSRTLLDFDITGGVFNNDRPAQEPINSSGSLFFTSWSPDSLRSVRGTSVSTHVAIQTNPWRNLFLSTSSLKTVRKDLLYELSIKNSYLYANSYLNAAFEDVYSYGLTKSEDSSFLSNIGLGWKFKPTFIAEYLYSVDFRNLSASHSFKIRYTFNLSITGEK
jgi:hypothetical protein